MLCCSSTVHCTVFSVQYYIHYGTSLMCQVVKMQNTKQLKQTCASFGWSHRPVMLQFWDPLLHLKRVIHRIISNDNHSWIEAHNSPSTTRRLISSLAYFSLWMVCLTRIVKKIRIISLPLPWQENLFPSASQFLFLLKAKMKSANTTLYVQCL